MGHSQRWAVLVFDGCSIIKNDFLYFLLLKKMRNTESAQL